MCVVPTPKDVYFYVHQDLVVEPKTAASPAPMDISSTSLDGAFSKQLLVLDIDAEDGDNPQLVSLYVNDIYDYMRHLEAEQCVRQHYLEGRDINGRMRGILVDWLVQVHLRFHLLQETLYLTIAIIDRFLQVGAVSASPKVTLVAGLGRRLGYRFVVVHGSCWPIYMV